MDTTDVDNRFTTSILNMVEAAREKSEILTTEIESNRTAIQWKDETIRELNRKSQALNQKLQMLGPALESSKLLIAKYQQDNIEANSLTVELQGSLANKQRVIEQIKYEKELGITTIKKYEALLDEKLGEIDRKDAALAELNEKLKEGDPGLMKKQIDDLLDKNRFNADEKKRYYDQSCKLEKDNVRLEKEIKNAKENQESMKKERDDALTDLVTIQHEKDELSIQLGKMKEERNEALASLGDMELLKDAAMERFKILTIDWIDTMDERDILKAKLSQLKEFEQALPPERKYCLRRISSALF